VSENKEAYIARKREEGKSASEKGKCAGLRFSAAISLRSLWSPCFFPIAVQTGLRKSDLLIMRARPVPH